MRSRGGLTWVCLTMPDKSGRQDDYQPMTGAEIDDLVALLASWRRQGDRLTTVHGALIDGTVSHSSYCRQGQASLRRRTLFRWLTGGLGAMAAMILAIPFAGYILGMRKRPVQWVPLGSIGDFPL